MRAFACRAHIARTNSSDAAALRGGVSRPSRNACTATPRHAGAGGHLHHRRQLPLVTMHAAGRQQAQHVHRRSAGARGFDGIDENRIAGELPVANRDVDPRVILVDDAARADVEVADFRVAHLAFRQADPQLDASIVVCGQVASRRVQSGASARVIALSAASSRQPNPSRISRTTGHACSPPVRTRRSTPRSCGSGCRKARWATPRSGISTSAPAASSTRTYTRIDDAIETASSRPIRC